MKIIVRGISEETTKDEVKAIIRAFCKCESVYAKTDLSNKGNLKGIKVYPAGSKSLVGYISYDVTSRTAVYYTLINRRQVVKTYVLREGGNE